MGVIGGAAHEILFDVEGDAPPLMEPVEDAARLAHHFGPEAVSGQNQQLGVRHGGRLQIA